METYESPRRKRSKARERQENRRRRRDSMAVQAPSTKVNSDSKFSLRLPNQRKFLQDIQLPGMDRVAGRLQGEWVGELRSRAGVLLRDGWWYVTHNPKIIRGLLFMVVIIIALYPISYLLSGRIFPNVETLGVNVGGMSAAAAEEVIFNEWAENVEISLTYNGDTLGSVEPHELGISLDVESTAKAAKNAGFSALPFGTSVEPIIEFDPLIAQEYLLNIGDQVNTRPISAGFRWEGEELIGIEGKEGRRLDVTLSIEQLERNAASVVNAGQFELMMIPIPPDRIDPEPFIEEAKEILAKPLELKGYDPYANQEFTWPIQRDTFASWLAVGSGSLTVHEDNFLDYMDAVNTFLNSEGENLRYIDTDEASNFVRDAIEVGETSINLRVRYHATQYEVQRGDTLFAISRKTGIPYFLLQEANSGIDVDFLVPGQTINVPTRDVTMPHPPDPNKRIIVDLINQYLIAYENNEVVFEWPISSGVENAPTSPGIYQILSREEVAVGSSITLCNQAGIQCGQWRMNWFMGIYNVTPGVVNGFHGDVLLPNGSFLGEGQLGSPATFGCVMSADDQALALFEWASVGTVVEIISDEYDPLSDLGKLAYQRINAA